MGREVLSKPFKKEFPSVSERAYLGYKKYVHVYDIMSRDVLMISPDASMAKAAKIMGDRHVGSLVVVEKEKATGIVTERDLLSGVIALEKDPKKVKVKDCMSKGLFTIRPIATAKEAAQEMMKKKGRLIDNARRLIGGPAQANVVGPQMPRSRGVRCTIRAVTAVAAPMLFPALR